MQGSHSQKPLLFEAKVKSLDVGLGSSFCVIAFVAVTMLRYALEHRTAPPRVSRGQSCPS